MKAIYIGAGTDVSPIEFLSHINDWVYVDCQPFSAFGISVHECDPEWCPPRCVGFSRPWFIPDIKQEMERIGMNYKKISDNELEFTKGDKKITYFVNTSMPEHIDRVKDRIKDFDNLIVMGHDPNSCILNYTSKKITFWGNTETIYSKIDREDEHYDYYKDYLCFKMNRDENIRKKFHRFNIIDRCGATSFDRWTTFITHKPR